MASKEDDLLPQDNSEYATKKYWDQRYEKDTGTYDWFKTFEQLKPALSKHMKTSDDILHIGCGNSILPEEMYDAGYTKIVNMDFSEAVIETMKERNKETRPLMQWEYGDIMGMKYENESFDICLDKGVMDAIMCERGDVWKVAPEVAEAVDKMCSEISRILKPGGSYIYITFGQPHFRKPLLELPKYNWNVTVETIGEFFHYFVYIVTKNK